MRRRRYRDHRFDDGNDVLRDGESVRVMLFDAGPGRPPLGVNVGDAMDSYMHFAAHRPHDASSLAYAAYPLQRDSRSLADAMRDRQRAFDELQARSENAWRKPLRTS
jgi:hypothetical protein